MLVADAVAHRLGEIGGERMVALAIDRSEPAERSSSDVVNHVRGVDDGARPARKPAVREAMQPREAAEEQGFEGPCFGGGRVERDCLWIRRRGVRRHRRLSRHRSVGFNNLYVV